MVHMDCEATDIHYSYCAVAHAESSGLGFPLSSPFIGDRDPQRELLPLCPVRELPINIWLGTMGNWIGEIYLIQQRFSLLKDTEYTLTQSVTFITATHFFSTLAA